MGQPGQRECAEGRIARRGSGGRGRARREFCPCSDLWSRGDAANPSLEAEGVTSCGLESCCGHTSVQSASSHGSAPVFSAGGGWGLGPVAAPPAFPGRQDPHPLALYWSAGNFPCALSNAIPRGCGLVLSLQRLLSMFLKGFFFFFSLPGAPGTNTFLRVTSAR